MADVSGTLPKGSIGDPANMLGNMTGTAGGNVTGSVSIEDALKELQDDGPPAVVAPKKVPKAPLEAKPTRYKVHITGEKGDQYLSNGDFVCAIPRNKDVIVTARVFEVLSQSQGIEFTHLPA